MKGRITFILALIVFFIGLGLFLYPVVNGWLVDKKAGEAIKDFKQDIYDAADKISLEDLDGKNNHQELYDSMVKYNQELFETGQVGLVDAWSYQQPALDLKNFGLEENVIGYIELPKISVTLPLYLGATESNMAKGAVSLGQTSLPIGGLNTNTVIAAHRGYKGAEFLKYIDKLELGDEVYVTNLWETLIYQVEEIVIIKPDDIQRVLIQEGKDLITLVTCHPRGANSHRYVVYCKRSA